MKTLEKVLFYQIKPHKVRFRSTDLDVSYRKSCEYEFNVHLQIKTGSCLSWLIFTRPQPSWIFPSKPLIPTSKWACYAVRKSCPNHSKAIRGKRRFTTYRLGLSGFHHQRGTQRRKEWLEIRVFRRWPCVTAGCLGWLVPKNINAKEKLLEQLDRNRA